MVISIQAQLKISMWNTKSYFWVPTEMRCSQRCPGDGDFKLRLTTLSFGTNIKQYGHGAKFLTGT